MLHELPSILSKAVSINWTMDTNHGVSTSAFSGHVQTQRGQMERWKFAMKIRRLTRREASAAQEFFMAIEGPLGLFRMYDPAGKNPLGTASGSPALSASASPGDRALVTAGWSPNVASLLMPGDWLEVGYQLFKVRSIASSSNSGACSIAVWPKVMVPLASGLPVRFRSARGVFRFTTDAPSWDVSADLILRNHEFSLTGTQEILTPELVESFADA